MLHIIYSMFRELSTDMGTAHRHASYRELSTDMLHIIYYKFRELSTDMGTVHRLGS